MKKYIVCFFICFLMFLPEIKAEEMPKLYFYGNMSSMNSKKDVRNITFEYHSEDINTSGYAKIKVQGTSSLLYIKKNYTIDFYEDASYSNKLKIDFGWGMQSKYCLKANWIDKTHARNIVTANITSMIQKEYNLFDATSNNGVIDGYGILIYLNDEFLGLYTLNIPKDGWMFGMDETNENHIVLSGGDWESSVLFEKTVDSWHDTAWEVEFGNEDEATLEKLNRVLSFVANSTDEEFKANIHEYFNFDSLLNYYVMCEFSDMIDNMGKNMLFVTYDGKIWYTSLYDLDTSFGTSSDGLTTLDNYTESIGISEINQLFNKLQRIFPNELANRYFELRKQFLTKEYVMDAFSTFENTILEEAFALETQKWGNIPGYDLIQIEEFLDARIPAIDQLFYSYYTIEPKVEIEYTKNEGHSVVAKLKSNRSDIVILDNNGTSYDYEYTFFNSGNYIFTYQDWFGNYKNEITAKATILDTHFLIPSFLIFILVITVIVRFLYKKRKYV